MSKDSQDIPTSSYILEYDPSSKLISREEKIELLKKYLLMKFYEDDFHGVQDAASDIRDLLSEIKALRSISSLV